MELLVLFAALVIGYLILRRKGGSGLDIRFDLAPARTQQGKRDRMLLWGVLVLLLLAVAFVFVRDHRDGRITVLMSFVAGVLAFVLFYIKDKFKGK